INLGTPDSPKTSDVRRYLSQFLNDPRVIDINPVGRAILVNLYIVPFRASDSSKIYKQLWTEDGSPLKIYGERLREELDRSLGADFDVELAMRYQNPSIPDVLEKMRKQKHEKLIVVPLFPQFASSSSGSALQKAMETIKDWWVIPEVQFLSQYFDDDKMLEAFAERGRQYDIASYDHILFSYHGLPERQVDKVYEEGVCEDRDCENEITQENKYCYKATCYATTRLLAEKLGIPEERYTVCFQSRLNDRWLKPFSDEMVREKAKEGAKRLLVFSPAFVADCLETNVEIGIEYQELFEEYGGEKVQLVESLNDHPLWVESLRDMILRRCKHLD
ncbi:MAG: ferrochelatase, partial [Flavobacteriales bacterium]